MVRNRVFLGSAGRQRMRLRDVIEQGFDSFRIGAAEHA